MYKQFIFLLALSILSVCPIVHAANIIWVGENDDQNADGVRDDLRWPAWLAEHGYTVDDLPNSWLTLDATKLARLNAADLVIISRNTDSDVYANNATEIAQWNAVTAPMVLLTPYLVRNNRWNWVNHANLTLLTGSPVWEAVVATHPVFFGMDLSASKQVSALDGAMAPSTGVYHLNAPFGNGVLIAQVAGSGQGAIVEWSPGVAAQTGGPIAGGRRLLFSCGTSESATTPQGAFNLTPMGEKMLLNAIRYMLGVNFYAATSSKPADKATDVMRDVTLSWTAGPLAVKHDVYFGADSDNVKQATRANPLGVLISQGQDAGTFDPPGSLEFGKTYYWRIDEVRADGSTLDVGAVWSFTTEPVAYAIRNVTATASSFDAGKGPDKTVDGSGLDASDGHSTLPTTMWISSKGGPSPVWIQYAFDRIYKLYELWVWNHNTDFESTLGLGFKNVTIQYSADGAEWKTLGDFDFAQAPGTDGYAHNTIANLGGIAARQVRIVMNSGWATGGQYGLGEVRFFQIPVYARESNPASGSANVDPAVTLSWRAGRDAVSHSIYLGTDPNALTPAGTSMVSSYSPANLNLGSTYYWRVDEVNAAGTPSIWAGEVWSFSIPSYRNIDDMESYNDTTNAIFDTWKDGYGTSNNGALAGNPNAPYAETTVIHGGKQSMPFAYNNVTAPLSEATRTFSPAMDWTANGVEVLTLYFSGSIGNKAGQLYVKINGTKVPYGGDASVLAKPWWTQWNINLASLGINLTSVSKLVIGVEGAGASGLLFIDDIRLYVVPPALATEEVWIETESAQTLPIEWESLARADACDGKYIGVKAGNNSMTAPPVGSIVSYPFTVKKGGTYTVRARAGVPTADDNSLWLRIQGATMSTAINVSGWVWWYDIATGAAWHWDTVRSYDDANKTAAFTLPAGSYNLEIAYREDGLLLDAFVITDKLD